MLTITTLRKTGDFPAGKQLQVLSGLIKDKSAELKLAFDAGTRTIPLADLAIKPRDLLLLKVLTRLDKLGLALDENCYTLVGLEGMYPTGKLNSDESATDSFNDSIALVRTEADGEIVLQRIVSATTEPGRFYTVQPLNANGAARLPIDTKFDRLWRRGAHKDQAKALVQAVEVIVLRDGNKDMLRTGDKAFSGHFGINFHSAKDAAKIGKWSAGCTVIQKQSDYDNCISDLYSSKQKLYSYILLDASKL